MESLVFAGVTEVGSLSWGLSLAVGQEGWERVEVVWEGWRRRWLGRGREGKPAGIFSLAYLGLPACG